ncbi:MAG: hypothetical protein VKQ33_01140 [Candidatus Sericytochromatia bacterium]|nr:hypothetical protein [Candidatus Sericytochromatia bacterium]
MASTSSPRFAPCPDARRGSVVPAALLMTTVIMGVVVAGLNWVSADMRRSHADRWRAVAADAAQTGLAMTLAWARSAIDRTRTTPVEWDVPDGEVVNPLRSLFDSPELKGLIPTDLSDLPRREATVGSRAIPARVGDLVDVEGAGEYVVGRYGDHVATVRVRLQPFRVSEGAPRQYRIGVAGRVWAYDAKNTAAGPHKGTRLVADRVLIATVGRQVLSRYATLTDIDLVGNWAPGERVEGPIHVNRGYVDAPLGLQPGNLTLQNGRSQMVLHAPGGYSVPAGAPAHPVFTDTVSMAYDARPGGFQDTDDFSSAVLCNRQALTNPTYTSELARAIFLAPENQAQIDGKAGPLMTTPVELPPNSRARLGAVCGMPEGQSPAGETWFQDLPDGVHVPTRAMVENGTSQYGGAGDFPRGGIYVRGTVEVMRLATTDTRSYYFFQVGYVKQAMPRRTYVAIADRATRQLRLKAFAPNSTIEGLLTQPLTDLEQAVTTSNDPADFAVWGTGLAPCEHTFLAPELGNTEAPFNGLIFVDYSRHDPARPSSGVAGAANARPLTGHILSLGDPGAPGASQTKRAFGWAWRTNLPPALAAAEVACTEDAAPGGTAPRRASRLTIIAAGDIFIQNHVVVKGIAEACGLEAGPDRLRRENVTASQTRDVLGLVSDKQIVVGLTAPSAAVRTDSGVVVTASLAALGDPAYDTVTSTMPAIPAAPTSPEGLRFKLRGSFTTEGLMHVWAEALGESYDVLWPATMVGSADALFDSDSDGYPQAGVATPPYPYCPVYGAGGEPGPNGLYAGLQNPRVGNPNFPGTRGKLTLFGGLVTRKRGAVGLGNASYDKDTRYDQRLLTLAPPLFPNSVNLVLQTSTLDGLGLPPYTGPKADEASFLEP